MRLLHAAAALLVLAGCAPDAPNSTSEPDRPAAEPAPVSGPAPTPAPASIEPPPDSAFLALEGEGLRVFLASTGSTRPLAFGTPSDDAVALLTTVLGADPVEQGEAADCAARYARWDDDLTVWFANGRFAGWHVTRGSTLTTVDGIGLGTTRSELEATREPTVMRSSLGVEFTVGALAGLLASDAPDAPVQHLWAGHTCIAR